MNANGNLLRRLMWPHGMRCLWFCPPWHRKGNHPTYAEYLARRDAEREEQGA